MKLYKTTITPTSNFASKLKGDTLFGQICWAISFLSGEERLRKLLDNYEENPFLVVSDPFPKGYLPKPAMPSVYLGEDGLKKKENRKKIWLTYEQLNKGDFANAKTTKDVNSEDFDKVVVRNSINYSSFTTEGDAFAPYGDKESKISSKDIYFLIDEIFELEELKSALRLVGQMGYGKDATIGKGRFTLSEPSEQNISFDGNTFMALNPFVPSDTPCVELFYEPFTRFGKTGASRANANPFKKPIILADTSAVICFENRQHLQYVGKAIKDISSYEDVVHQGYSIVVPIKDFS